MDNQNEELQITVVAGGATAQCTPVSVTSVAVGPHKPSFSASLPLLETAAILFMQWCFILSGNYRSPIPLP
jgi:hypothetical protein